MHRVAWRATAHGVTESDTTAQLAHTQPLLWPGVWTCVEGRGPRPVAGAGFSGLSVHLASSGGRCMS